MLLRFKVLSERGRSLLDKKQMKGGVDVQMFC